MQKFELFPKTLLPGRAATPQQAGGKPPSPDGESAPGTSSPDGRHGSGSENGDGESFLSSPVSKGPKEGEESPGSISPLGSDSGSEADKDERDPSPSAGGRQRTPIDILTRVFPAHRRGVLELVLQGCGGDVVQAIEPTRIITDPLSGRSYCKGRLLGKVPIGVGVVGGSAVIRCGREPPPGSEERGLSESPPFRSSGSGGSAGPAPAYLSQRTSVSGRPAGPCVGRRFPPRFPGPLRHMQL